MPHERGWFYHFVDPATGARQWQSELSSIDTALLLAGVITVRGCFPEAPDVARYARRILSFRDGRVTRDEAVRDPLEARALLAILPLEDAEEIEVDA